MYAISMWNRTASKKIQLEMAHSFDIIDFDSFGRKKGISYFLVSSDKLSSVSFMLFISLKPN